MKINSRNWLLGKKKRCGKRFQALWLKQSTQGKNNPQSKVVVTHVTHNLEWQRGANRPNSTEITQYIELTDAAIWYLLEYDPPVQCCQIVYLIKVFFMPHPVLCLRKINRSTKYSEDLDSIHFKTWFSSLSYTKDQLNQTWGYYMYLGLENKKKWQNIESTAQTTVIFTLQTLYFTKSNTKYLHENRNTQNVMLCKFSVYVTCTINTDV